MSFTSTRESTEASYTSWKRNLRRREKCHGQNYPMTPRGYKQVLAPDFSKTSSLRRKSRGKKTSRQFSSSRRGRTMGSLLRISLPQIPARRRLKNSKEWLTKSSIQFETEGQYHVVRAIINFTTQTGKAHGGPTLKCHTELSKPLKPKLRTMPSPPTTQSSFKRNLSFLPVSLKPPLRRITWKSKEERGGLLELSDRKVTGSRLWITHRCLNSRDTRKWGKMPFRLSRRPLRKSGL